MPPSLPATAAAHAPPGIVLEAFLPERIAAGDIPFKACNLARLMQHQLAAPSLLKESDPARFDLREIAAAAFIMSQDEDLCEELLSHREKDATGTVTFPRFSAEVFRLAKQISPSTLQLIGQAIDSSLNAAMKPAMAFGARKGHAARQPFSSGPGRRIRARLDPHADRYPRP